MNEYKKFSYYFDEAVSSLDYSLWLDFIEPYLKPKDIKVTKRLSDDFSRKMLFSLSFNCLFDIYVVSII